MKAIPSAVRTQSPIDRQLKLVKLETLSQAAQMCKRNTAFLPRGGQLPPPLSLNALDTNQYLSDNPPHLHVNHISSQISVL